MHANVLHLITVEDQDLAPEQAAQGFDRLRLAGASRTVRVSPEPHLHGLGQSQVALVSQRGVHQLGRVSLTDRQPQCRWRSATWREETDRETGRQTAGETQFKIQLLWCRESMGQKCLR